MKALPISSSPSMTPSFTASQQNSVTGSKIVQAIKLLPSERWLYVGKTGSGKSYLARHNLRILSAAGWRIALVDPEAFWMGIKGKWATDGPGTVDAPRRVQQFDPKLRVQLYVPTHPGYQDDGLTAYCLGAMKQGGVVMYFDEAYGVSDHARINPGVLQVWTQGRKHNVGGQVSVQRPARIPEYFLSQAENWAVFRVVGEDDRKKLAQFSNSPQMHDVLIPSRYWWYWHQETMDSAQLMRPLSTGEPGTPGGNGATPPQKKEATPHG